MLSRLLAALWGRPTVPPHSPPNPCPVGRDALYGRPDMRVRILGSAPLPKAAWQPRRYTKTVYVWSEAMQAHVAIVEET